MSEIHFLLKQQMACEVYLIHEQKQIDPKNNILSANFCSADLYKLY